jgi:malate permease and related proteins
LTVDGKARGDKFVMLIIAAAFKSVAILLGIGVIGFWIIRRQIVPREVLKVISPLVIDIALPCLVFAEIMARFNPRSMMGWWVLPLWWAGFTVWSGAVTWLITRFAPSSSKEIGMGLLYPNALFTPLVIIPGIFGADTLLMSELFLFTILFPLFLFNSYQYIFGKKTPAISITWQKLLNPILVATILALVLKLLALESFVPEVVFSITKLVGALSLPLVMILLGGSIYVDLENRQKFFKQEVIFFVLSKNILLPAVTLLPLLALRPRFTVAFLFFMQSILPPVTTLPLLTKRVGGNESLANQFVVASFLFSLLSIPVALWVFSLFFPWG